MNHWEIERNKKAFLALESGEIFKGYAVGAHLDGLGEVVFNTGMTGYQEIISDPSYAGQFVALTSPEIGNYGTTPKDMESRGVFCNGFIIHKLNPPSSSRSEQPFEAFLIKHNIPAIAGVDVRRLTLLLRNSGTKKAFLHCADDSIENAFAVEEAKRWRGLDGQDYACLVSSKTSYSFNSSGKYHIAVLDYGVKYNILRLLEKANMRITVLPAQSTVADVLAIKPDGVFLSNGPADPSAVKYAIAMAKELTGRLPVMGICLGHQLLGLSMGADCNRLKFGHHGINHPVKDLRTGTVAITSQNHNYSLSKDSLPSFLELTHINLNDGTVEGIEHKREPMFSVQYHPEASPGPNDSDYLFERFRQMIEAS